MIIILLIYKLCIIKYTLIIINIATDSIIIVIFPVNKRKNETFLKILLIMIKELLEGAD